MANPLSTDYSRLFTTFPDRTSQRDQRAGKRNAVNLFADSKEEDFEWPKTASVDVGTRFHLSRVMDESMLRIYNECVKKIQGTKEHSANYKELCDAPKTCGGFSLGKSILENATPFEQMVAFDQWISRKAPNWTKGRRTLCFRQGDDQVVPLYIASTAKSRATTMTTTLGTGKGSLKAPRYLQFANDENLANNSVFAKPLESLEIVRQPNFSAATVLKGDAFETDVISHTRRYEIIDINNASKKSQFACVELEKQNAPSNSPTKEKSAATNLISLLKKNPNNTINPYMRYEDFGSEGYKDNINIEVTPKALWTALEKSVCNDESRELDDLTRKLFVAKVQPFTSKAVGNFYADLIFPKKEGS